MVLSVVSIALIGAGDINGVYSAPVLSCPAKSIEFEFDTAQNISLTNIWFGQPTPSNSLSATVVLVYPTISESPLSKITIDRCMFGSDSTSGTAIMIKQPWKLQVSISNTVCLTQFCLRTTYDVQSAMYLNDFSVENCYFAGTIFLNIWALYPYNTTADTADTADTVDTGTSTGVVGGAGVSSGGTGIRLTNTIFKGLPNSVAPLPFGAVLYVYVIELEVPITIINCSFSEFTVASGGPITIDAATMYQPIYIANSQFLSNTVTGVDGSMVGAGAILFLLNTIAASITVTNSVFRDNRCLDDEMMIIRTVTGAVSARASDVSTQSAGGAIIISGTVIWGATTQLTISDCEFTRNVALRGGAVCIARFVSIRTTPPMLISNCSFTSNFGAFGGSIVLDSKSAQWNIHIRDSYFSGGVSRLGGAIASLGDDELIINHTRFISNVASVLGGAIFCSASSHTTVIDTLFQNNNCTSSVMIYVLFFWCAFVLSLTTLLWSWIVRVGRGDRRRGTRTDRNSQL